MLSRGPASVLLAVALAAGACLGAHDSRKPADPGGARHTPARSERNAAAPTPDRAPAPAAPAPEPTATIDFSAQVRPVLEAHCQPCHFPGGTMYEKLPFDQAATIRGLGERLFTRIKAEDEQALIRAFLAQPVPARQATNER